MRADCKEEVIVPVDWICRVLYWKVRKYARLSELSVVLPSVLQPWLDLTKCSSLPLFATKLQKTQSKGKFVREDFLVYDHTRGYMEFVKRPWSNVPRRTTAVDSD